jgi:hypothetical protein
VLIVLVPPPHAVKTSNESGDRLRILSVFLKTLIIYP